MDMYETDDASSSCSTWPASTPSRPKCTPSRTLLTVRGVRRERHAPYAPDEQRSYHALEIPYGRFERTLRLPPGHRHRRGARQLSRGLLEITLPKRHGRTRCRSAPRTRRRAA